MGNRITEKRKLLSDRRADLSNTRNACPNLVKAWERRQASPGRDIFIP